MGDPRSLWRGVEGRAFLPPDGGRLPTRRLKTRLKDITRIRNRRAAPLATCCDGPSPNNYFARWIRQFDSIGLADSRIGSVNSPAKAEREKPV